MKWRFWGVYLPIVAMVIGGVYLAIAHLPDVPMVISDTEMAQLRGSLIYDEMECDKNLGYCDTFGCPQVIPNVAQYPLAEYQGCIGSAGKKCETLAEYNYCVQDYYNYGCDGPITWHRIMTTPECRTIE